MISHTIWIIFCKLNSHFIFSKQSQYFLFSFCSSKKLRALKRKKWKYFVINNLMENYWFFSFLLTTSLKLTPIVVKGSYRIIDVLNAARLGEMWLVSFIIKPPVFVLLYQSKYWQSSKDFLVIGQKRLWWLFRGERLLWASPIEICATTVPDIIRDGDSS